MGLDEEIIIVMTLKQTFYLISTDIERYAQENKLTLSFLKKISIFFTPCVMSIAIHRIGHFFFKKNLHVIARMMWTMNIVLFSLDITPFTEIGSHFYLPHPVGVGIMGRVGNRVTFFIQTGTAGRKPKDIGAGLGGSIIGDDVVIGAFSKIIGPVKIGNRARIAPGSMVYRNVPEDVTVFGIPAKIINKRGHESNPGEDNE